MRAKIVAVVVLAVTLSGCTGIQKYIQSKIQDNSGILKREEYLIYQQYQSEGKIGTDNYYQENYPDITIEKGKIDDVIIMMKRGQQE